MDTPTSHTHIRRIWKLRPLALIHLMHGEPPLVGEGKSISLFHSLGKRMKLGRVSTKGYVRWNRALTTLLGNDYIQIEGVAKLMAFDLTLGMATGRGRTGDHTPHPRSPMVEIFLPPSPIPDGEPITAPIPGS
ncbi:hypothetical protein CsSME_00001567 [Camellia sinensis var. sinensis]